MLKSQNKNFKIFISIFILFFCCFIQFQKSYATDTCKSNYNLTSNSSNVYGLDNYISKMKATVNCVDTTPTDAQKAKLQCTINFPKNYNDSWIKTYYNGTAFKYYVLWQYIPTKIDIEIDGKKIDYKHINPFYYEIDKSNNTATNKHWVQIFTTYSGSNEKYCITNTINVNDAYKYAKDTLTNAKIYPSFTLDDLQTIVVTADICQILKKDTETAFCDASLCMRQLAQGSDYWNKNQPSDTGAFLNTISMGTWDIPTQDFTDKGKEKLSECKIKLQRANDKSKELINNNNCKGTIVSVGADCSFGGVKQDLPIDKLTDYVGKLTNTLSKIQQSVTTNTYSSGVQTACEITAKCSENPDIVQKMVCQGMCWISEAFMSIVNWSFSILGAALSTDSQTVKTPQQVQSELKLNVTGSNTTNSTLTGTTGTDGTSTNTSTTPTFPDITPVEEGELSPI